VEITTSTESDASVVFLKGDLDVYSTSMVEETLAAAVDGAKRVIVDLSAVPFADSSGLGGLIAAYKKAQARGVEMRLRKPTPIVSEILTITRMKRFFPVDE
jgi:anti-sigma B factor antagonist